MPEVIRIADTYPYKSDTFDNKFRPNRINSEDGKCYRFAVRGDQGVGWSEYEGTDMVWPEIEPITIFGADDDLPRQLAIDESTGLLYEISLRDGPENTGIKRGYTDKEDQYAGTEISTEVLFPERSASQEHFGLEFEEQHTYTRPQDEKQRNKDGHDANGYRNAHELEVAVLADGEPTKAIAKTRDTPLNGDNTIDKKVEVNRGQIRVRTTTSEFRIAGVMEYWKEIDKRSAPNDITMTEHVFQEDLSDTFFWLSRDARPTLNRTLGSLVSGSIAGTITGPDGKSASAMIFSTSTGLTTTVDTITGDFSILFSIASVDASVTVFAFSTGSVNVNVNRTGNTYSLEFDDGGDLKSETLTWDGTGFVTLAITRDGDSITFKENGKQLNSRLISNINSFGGTLTILDNQAATLFDPRGIITALSTRGFEYYHEDIVDNEGDAVLPVF